MAEIVPVRPQAPDEAALRRAAEALARGAAIALPTDTLYGLCARALDPAALERLFAAKGRGGEKGAPVLIGSPDQLPLLAARTPEGARALIGRLWPGPLTLIFPARDALSPFLTGGEGGGVAVRLPDQALCRRLAAEAGPFAATSANRPGAPPLRGAGEIAEEFGERIALILDGGALPEERPSTLVDVRGAAPVLLREGRAPFDEVLKAWGEG
ncbi:MAG: L-threonylcarbamoyladenylate synthase [bacterium]